MRLLTTLLEITASLLPLAFLPLAVPFLCLHGGTTYRELTVE